MRPWEVETTVDKIKGMSGEETVKMGIDLTSTSLSILTDSIRNSQPGIEEKGLIWELKKIIWEDKDG